MKQVIVFFKRHFLVRDTIVAVAVFYGFIFSLDKFLGRKFVSLIHVNDKVLFPIFLNSGITLLGFLITGLSVLVGFLNNEKLNRLKDAGYYKDIFGIYFNAIVVCGIFIALSLWGLLSLSLLICHLISIAMFLLVARIWRCVWIVQQIAIIINK
ncbi:MAG: hypothetical protein LBQ14_07060 [Treponema sp.]|jgi:hypothetical protein|nr:hypothetical protein [Treponema sp.]